jgi:hypothetical protein
MDLNQKAHAEILGPDGTPINKPARFLTFEEAQLLREYQAFGEREFLQGSMVCGDCGKDMEVHVESDIGIFCECRMLLFKGVQ